jgi:hypothetical protein
MNIPCDSIAAVSLDIVENNRGTVIAQVRGSPEISSNIRLRKNSVVQNDKLAIFLQHIQKASQTLESHNQPPTYH